MKILLALFLLIPVFCFADITFPGIAGEDLDDCKAIAKDEAASATALTSIYMYMHTIGTPFPADGIMMYDVLADGNFDFLFHGTWTCLAPAGGVTKGDTINADTTDSTLTIGAGTFIGHALTTAAAGQPFQIYVHPLSSGGGGGGGSDHNILSSTHADTDSVVTNSVSRGSFIFGNATPAWDEFTAGADDDMIIYDIDGDPEKKALPDCDEGAGEINHYDKASNTWGCVTLQQFGVNPYMNCDHRTSTCWYEEFDGDDLGFVLGTSTGALGAGRYNWTYYTQGTSSRAGASICNASPFDAAVTHVQERPGKISLSTGSSTTGRACAFRQRTAVIISTTSQGETSYEIAFLVPTLSDATHTYNLLAGLTIQNGGTANCYDAVSLVPDQGVYLRYSNGVNSGKFLLESRVNSAAGVTTDDTGVTVVANTWYTAKFTFNATWTNVDVAIADTYPNPDLTTVDANVTSNIPGSTATHAINPTFTMFKSAGSSGDRFMCIDYAGYNAQFESGR